MPKANNLRYLRQKAGLTQEALSKETGFAKSTINAWETTKRSIPAPRTKELADYFGVSYTDFCRTDFEEIDNAAFTLTESEKENIVKFRALPENIKDVIRLAVRAEYENMKGDAS